MKRSDLTRRQQKVVAASDDLMLVTGGAGTGKTTVALWAARAELEKPENRRKRALFLTFSRTAVDQIAARSRSVVAPVEDRIEVSTFHSFAYRLIRRFGHIAGLTDRNPEVQSASQAKLLGEAPGQLVYNDLAPLALQILDDRRVVELLARRWCMVICDEFQDTGNNQWSLLERLNSPARLLLLGDEHQLIYGFLAQTGVVPERMRATQRIVDRVVELEPASHRDPSGAIPAFATAVRQRRFDDSSIHNAVENDRLHIHVGVNEENLVSIIGNALDAAWSRGARTFGIFTHTNQSVAELSFRLSEAGIDHHLVGLPDAEADALEAMLALTRYAYGEHDWPTVQVALATYLTACTRGSTPPKLAVDLTKGRPLPSGLQERIERLQAAVGSAATDSLSHVADVAASAWSSLGMTASSAPWSRTAPSFQALARRSAREAATPTTSLANAISRLRIGAMFDSQRRRLPAVQVMNLHQTKGREADAVVILCGDDDYHGREDEPFVEASRLLYVVLTRARNEVTMVFGDDPHPLVAPLAELG